MYSFNTFADSFILLQSTGLSVPITHILIGHILMAFVVEFGFRSYLQNIVETKMNTFFASIVVGLMYSVFSANTTYGTEFAAYNFLYTFSFSMILGELIRATKGRTIYIATTFHASMTFGLIFVSQRRNRRSIFNQSHRHFNSNRCSRIHWFKLNYPRYCIFNNKTKS